MLYIIQQTLFILYWVYLLAVIIDKTRNYESKFKCRAKYKYLEEEPERINIQNKDKTPSYFKHDKEPVIPENANIVIGIGGSGYSVVNKMSAMENVDPSIVNPFFMVVDFDMIYSINDKESSISRQNYILLNEVDDSLSTRWYHYRHQVDLYDVVLLHYEQRLRPIVVSRPRKIYIVTGLGGTSGYKACSLMKYFTSCGVSVTTVVSMPFKFEGGKKYDNAKKTLACINFFTSDVIAYWSDDLIREIPGLTLSHAYGVLDNKLIAIILGQTRCLHTSTDICSINIK